MAVSQYSCWAQSNIPSSSQLSPNKRAVEQRGHCVDKSSFHRSRFGKLRAKGMKDRTGGRVIAGSDDGVQTACAHLHAQDTTRKRGITYSSHCPHERPLSDYQPKLHPSKIPPKLNDSSNTRTCTRSQFPLQNELSSARERNIEIFCGGHCSKRRVGTFNYEE